MNTRQISFAITGMREACAKCAVTIERALAQLEGVVAAQVNFATERAVVICDPGRVSLSEMVRVVQGEGFDVPLVRVVLNVNDLIYATSARTVERALGHVDGVAHVEADLRGRQIRMDVLVDRVHRDDYVRRLAALGLSVGDVPALNATRNFGLRAALTMGLAFPSLLSAGAHAGWFEIGFIHAPLVVMVSAVVIAYGIAWRFYRVAFKTALLHSEVDASVIVALVATMSLFCGLPLAAIASKSIFTTSGFIIAILLTAGWFIVRVATLWIVPRLRHSSAKYPSATQPALGIIPHGSRH
jgi:Cu+-exporting ATPase